MRVVACALSCAVSQAQQFATVPSAADGVEARSLVWLAGTARALRQQIVIDASHLLPLVGRDLTRIVLRRDTNDGRGRVGGDVDLVVRIGAASLPPSRASRTFAANVASPSEVFRGTVRLPASPAVAGFVGWDPAHVVDIAFATAFRYGGGDLCVELEGTPVGAGAGWWPVDAVADSASGRVTHHGRTCGPFGGPAGSSNAVAAAALVPGETVTFVARGKPLAVAHLLVGVSMLPVPIDLGVLGAPGCVLAVDAFAALSTTFGTALFGVEFGGHAALRVALPGEARLLGARFVTQWVDLGPPLTTSEAVECEVAGQLPALGMALVEGVLGSGEGSVSVTGAPVLRFGYR